MTTTTTRHADRAQDGRLLAGVCRGLADHLRVDVRWVRLGFVLGAGVSGMGLLAYAIYWGVLPSRADDDARREPATAWLVAGAVGLGVLVVVGGLFTLRLWPLAVVAAGAALVWQQADEAVVRRQVGGRRLALARTAGGVVLAIVGLITLLAGSVDLGNIGRTVVAVLVSLAGLALVTAPWWLRLLRQLDDERAGRVRATERAEIAAHLHDSVLQTLALIQQASSDPRQVVRLARTQERELRGWLYERPVEPGRLQTALSSAAAEVERAHGVPVEVVAVGDADLDEHLGALVRAAREAAGNAARHSGAEVVSMYLEVEGDQVSVFVRDRGCGFDPDAVPADRMGLRESVQGRMARHGGSARVRSGQSGTEVALSMPRRKSSTDSERPLPAAGPTAAGAADGSVPASAQASS